MTESRIARLQSRLRGTNRSPQEKSRANPKDFCINCWCREGESNPHRAFAPADFKSAASANFAIPASSNRRS